jgi:hypothetical protein
MELSSKFMTTCNRLNKQETIKVNQRNHLICG